MINIDSNDKSNVFDIDKSNKFINSWIKITGINNNIKIEESKYEINNLNIELRGNNNLNIELRGNNNKIIISNTIKKLIV